MASAYGWMVGLPGLDVATGFPIGRSIPLPGAAWNGWMVARRPWSADALGGVGGALTGYLVITFVYYWWHRLRHESDFLWRWLHQLHHSAQRLEIITSFYKHPLEIMADGFVSMIVLYWIVGLGPEAAAGATLIGGLAELFYHWNVRTPYWLGFVFQRPESHCVHHQEGVHSFNYSDLPIWDMLFGTFRNPGRSSDARCGFGEDEHRVVWKCCKGWILRRTVLEAHCEPASRTCSPGPGPAANGR